MNNVAYTSLMLSNIANTEDFDNFISDWLSNNFTQNEIGPYILYCISTSGLYPCSKITEDSLKEYCNSISKKYFDGNNAVFASKFIFASMWSNHLNKTKQMYTINDMVNLWGGALSAYTRQGDSYLDLDYIGDIARVNYLIACYPSISEYTNEIREISKQLIENKDCFESYEKKYRSMT